MSGIFSPIALRRHGVENSSQLLCGVKYSAVRMCLCLLLQSCRCATLPTINAFYLVHERYRRKPW
jgi:hypothetical protein